MKQLIPTDIDEYIAEHKIGDEVSGRVVEQSPTHTVVELGEGIRCVCRAATTPKTAPAAVEKKPAAKVDLSHLSSMLKDRWKGNTTAESAKAEPLGEGQIRSFTIVLLDPEAKKIEVESV
jgi:small subunit ribosomal protein S1